MNCENVRMTRGSLAPPSFEVFGTRTLCRVADAAKASEVVPRVRSSTRQRHNMVSRQRILTRTCVSTDSTTTFLVNHLSRYRTPIRTVSLTRLATAMTADAHLAATNWATAVAAWMLQHRSSSIRRFHQIFDLTIQPFTTFIDVRLSQTTNREFVNAKKFKVSVVWI